MTWLRYGAHGDVTRRIGDVVVVVVVTRPNRGLDTGDSARASSWSLAPGVVRSVGIETLRLRKPDQRALTNDRFGDEGIECGKQGISVSELVAVLLSSRCDAENELARRFLPPHPPENPPVKFDGTARPLAAFVPNDEDPPPVQEKLSYMKGNCVQKELSVIFRLSRAVGSGLD